MDSLVQNSTLRFTRFKIVASVLLFCCFMGLAWMVVAETKNGFELDDSLVPASKILRGGPPRDGIAAIDKPIFMPAHRATLVADEAVIGVQLNGIAKAYPIRILNRHEVVNDSFAATRVVVSYCPLCGSGVVFLLPEVVASSAFGVSGLLYNSDVLLYDRDSESLWSQLRLQAISGKHRGENLTLLAATHTSWGEWQKRFPDSLLLSEASGPNKNYSHNPYGAYETSEQLWFPIEHKSDVLPAKERVLGLSINGVDIAYPYSELTKSAARFEDLVAGRYVTIVWSPASRSAYVLDSEGRQLPTVSAYWFAWFGFHPQTLIYRANHLLSEK